MQSDKRDGSGVFRPCEVNQMYEELKRGDVPGESPLEREQRAIAIIHRHSMKPPARVGTSVPRVERTH